jgi:hypothetical protein
MGSRNTKGQSKNLLGGCGWPEGIIYEKKRLAETSDAKNDKLWDASVAEAEANKSKGKSWRAAAESRWRFLGSSSLVQLPTAGSISALSRCVFSKE